MIYPKFSQRYLATVVLCFILTLGTLGILFLVYLFNDGNLPLIMPASTHSGHTNHGLHSTYTSHAHHAQITVGRGGMGRAEFVTLRPVSELRNGLDDEDLLQQQQSQDIEHSQMPTFKSTIEATKSASNQPQDQNMQSFINIMKYKLQHMIVTIDDTGINEDASDRKPPQRSGIVREQSAFEGFAELSDDLDEGTYIESVTDENIDGNNSNSSNNNSYDMTGYAETNSNDNKKVHDDDLMVSSAPELARVSNSIDTIYIDDFERPERDRETMDEKKFKLDSHDSSPHFLDSFHMSHESAPFLRSTQKQLRAKNPGIRKQQQQPSNSPNIDAMGSSTNSAFSGHMRTELPTKSSRSKAGRNRQWGRPKNFRGRSGRRMKQQHQQQGLQDSLQPQNTTITMNELSKLPKMVSKVAQLTGKSNALNTLADDEDVQLGSSRLLEPDELDELAGSGSGAGDFDVFDDELVNVARVSRIKSNALRTHNESDKKHISQSLTAPSLKKGTGSRRRLRKLGVANRTFRRSNSETSSISSALPIVSSVVSPPSVSTAGTAVPFTTRFSKHATEIGDDEEQKQGHRPLTVVKVNDEVEAVADRRLDKRPSSVELLLATPGTASAARTGLAPPSVQPAPLSGHSEIGGGGSSAAWLETRTRRIIGNVKKSEERSRRLLLCEEAGGGELCRMLFKGHVNE